MCPPRFFLCKFTSWSPGSHQFMLCQQACQQMAGSSQAAILLWPQPSIVFGNPVFPLCSVAPGIVMASLGFRFKTVSSFLVCSLKSGHISVNCLFTKIYLGKHFWLCHLLLIRTLTGTCMYKIPITVSDNFIAKCHSSIFSWTYVSVGTKDWLPPWCAILTLRLFWVQSNQNQAGARKALGFPLNCLHLHWKGTSASKKRISKESLRNSSA